MSPVAVLVVAVLLACAFWLIGAEIGQGVSMLALGVGVLVHLAWAWPELRPAILCGPPLGFAAGVAPRLRAWWPR